MNYDILDIYYPDFSELDPERVEEIRDALARRLEKAGESGTDTSPNSVFGDLYVTPAAWHLTAAEEARNRFMTDLDPANAAEGVVWNCDFVERFLKNFGIYDETGQPGYGLVRLVFEDRQERTLDRGTVFFVSGGSYKPSLRFPGPLSLLPLGAAGNEKENIAWYSPLAPGKWAVDVLVSGEAKNPVNNGASVTFDREIDGLRAAKVLGDFGDGIPPSSLQELARRARSTFYARTPSTRGGVKSYLNHLYPDIVTVSATVSGDQEMTRDSSNPLVVRAGKMDVHARSCFFVQDTVTIPVRYISTTNGMRFVGKLELPEIPVRLLSFYGSGTPIVPTVYSASSDPERLPGLSSAYGSSEDLWVSFPMPTTDGSPDMSLYTDDDGDYGLLDVDYEFDRTLRTAVEALSGADSSPVGLDTAVRWFVPVEISRMTISYVRKAGVKMDLPLAKKEILRVYNSHSYDSPAGPAAIADAMAAAGAVSVVSIRLDAHVRYSVANKVWVSGEYPEPKDQASFAAFTAGCKEIPGRAVTNLYEPSGEYLAQYPEFHAASGDRNISWILDDAAVEFVEENCI